jgi:hypothetical protein
MTTKLVEIRCQKSAFADQRKSMLEELEIQYAKIHELWLTSVAIQKDEGHDPSPEPTEKEPFPYLDVDIIFKSAQAQDRTLTEITTTRDKARAKYDIQSADIKTLDAKCASLVMESTEINGTSQRAHAMELERTEQHEKFIADLVTERDEAMTLRRSRDDLDNDLLSERKQLEEKLKDEGNVIDRTTLDLDRLRLIVTLNNVALVKNQAKFELEKCQTDLQLNAIMKETNDAKAAFEKAQRQAKVLCDKGDLALAREADEIIRAQSIMVEGSKAKIARLLKGAKINGLF